MRTVQRSALCRSRRELSNAYLLAKIGVDTAENEPLEVWGRKFNSIFTSLLRPGEKVFFEETSLVGRGDRRLEFATLKRRLLRRLEFLGISYDPASVREEEFGERGALNLPVLLLIHSLLPVKPVNHSPR